MELQEEEMMSELQMNKKRYGTIDGLRTYSAISIVLMHVLANGNYDLSGFAFSRVIPSFRDMVFLFMVISAFSMCCGYYEKIIDNRISVSEFYNKRYAKIWPFFALLCVLDFIIAPSKNTLYEIFANLTLCFGLLPNTNISVIGVGWFLGLVFVFYLVFPFFCYLISNKIRAWFSFFVALVFNFLCTIRFTVGRENIVYSSVFFFAGGLIFLYKEKLSELANRFRWVILVAILGLVMAYYTVSNSTQIVLVLFSMVLIYALRTNGSTRILYNPFTKFVSDISMEVYLSHMVIFRVIEELGFTKAFASDLLSYIVTSIGTISGTFVFSLAIRRLFNYLNTQFKEKILYPKG